MPYSIISSSRPKYRYFVRIAVFGLGALFFQTAFYLYFITERNEPDVLFFFLLLFCVLAYLGCVVFHFAQIALSWRRIRSAKINTEWDKFVNNAMEIQFDQPAPADVESWLDSHLPRLDANSRTAGWLSELKIPFQPPVTVMLRNPIQSRKFAAQFEYEAFSALKKQLDCDHRNKRLGSLMATGRVILHGKPHSLVFRQPTVDEMILFVFRVEVVGTVASILCGATHFIRRSVATGQHAQRWRLSDDDYHDLLILDLFQPHLLMLYLPFFGLVAMLFIPIFLAFFVFIFILQIFSPFFGSEYGELGAWESVNDTIKKKTLPGLQPDRTAVLAEIDYMTRMLQNEILREVHAAYGSQSPKQVMETKTPPHSSSKDSSGFL